ncbi:AraC family transcriptional regulator [Microbacterium karelineae]|uniref:AraC family transcriptional regulator n=1 Tax=Microbacterium karelineae TaxID=2654283 RepID=UPI0012EAA7D1|nr:helix-turn-helix domain-containing protein [Microbacterium karelineae]
MYEEHHPDSPIVECVWQARAMKDERYLVAAVEYWDLWFARQASGELITGLSGPALGHRWIRSTIGEHSWGVQLRPHVVLPGVSKEMLRGGERRLEVHEGNIALGQQVVRFPEFEELDDFVERLLALDVLRCDDDVRRMLSGDGTAYSERHRQRRVRAVTGLTRKQIEQLSRARDAFALLLQGVPPIECAARCGFADQAHLTRALKAFHGQTPARVLSGR